MTLFQDPPHSIQINNAGPIIRRCCINQCETSSSLKVVRLTPCRHVQFSRLPEVHLIITFLCIKALWEYCPITCVCQTHFHTGAPKIIFHIPRNPIRTKTFTGQKRLIVGKRNSDAARLLSRRCICKDCYACKRPYIKRKKARNFPVFEGCFEFSHYFRISKF